MHKHDESEFNLQKIEHQPVAKLWTWVFKEDLNKNANRGYDRVWCCGIRGRFL